MAPRKENGQEEAAGAPEWMVTFSDCMTLLLTFFVLLLTFSSFDDKDIHTRRDAFSEALSSLGNDTMTTSEGIVQRDVVHHERLKVQGAEKPPAENKIDNKSTQELDPIDFKNSKVFLFNANSFFYGNGVVLSGKGKSYLKEIIASMDLISNRVLICEYSAKQDLLGPARSAAIFDYLSNHGIKKNRLCISVTGLYPKQSLINNNRIVEIAFLDQEIFN